MSIRTGVTGIGRVSGHLALGFLALLLGEAVAALTSRWPKPTELPDLSTTPDRVDRHIVWIGDSTAESVGATSVVRSLPHLFAAEFRGQTRTTVLASFGARIHHVLTEQLPQLRTLITDNDTTSNIVVVSVGANDVTGLTLRTVFRERYRTLLALLPKSVTVVVLGVPDLTRVPRIAQPLRWFIARRARSFDRVIEACVRDFPAQHIAYARVNNIGALAQRHSSELYAADGFHESDSSYQAWINHLRSEIPQVFTPR